MILLFERQDKTFYSKSLKQVDFYTFPDLDEKNNAVSQK